MKYIKPFNESLSEEYYIDILPSDYHHVEWVDVEGRYIDIIRHRLKKFYI